MTSTNGQGHTKGPWKWHPRSISAEHNGSVYREPIPGHAYAVAMQPRYVSDEEWTANARLIAAAPDLLESVAPFAKACELAAWPTFEDDRCLVDSSFGLTVGDLRRARAALSRVSGEGR